MTKLRLVCASAILATTASGTALAEVSANVGFMSDYIFRGTYQAESSAFGGLDIETDSGFYFGTWGANLKDGYEYDLYAGYAGGGENFQWYAGVTGYYYTDEFDDTYEEINLGFSYGFLNLDYAIGDYNGMVFDVAGNQVNGQPGGSNQKQTYEFFSWTFTPEIGPYYSINKVDYHSICRPPSDGPCGVGGSSGWYYEVGKSFEIVDDLEIAVAALFSTDTDGLGGPSPLQLAGPNSSGDTTSEVAFTVTLTKSISIGD